jgi:hypothetical protein
MCFLLYMFLYALSRVRAFGDVREGVNGFYDDDVTGNGGIAPTWYSHHGCMACRVAVQPDPDRMLYLQQVPRQPFWIGRG